MTKVFYDEATKLEKKVKLSSYFDSINIALDAISVINIPDSWISEHNSSSNSSLADLIDLIPTIKNSLTSYDNYLNVADRTYKSASDEIKGVLKNYNDK